MSIDERLRRGLRADMSTDPVAGLDVRAGRAIERGRRRRMVRRATTAVVIAAIALAGAVTVPQLLRSARVSTPAVTPTASPPIDAGQGPIVGTFQLFVPPGTRGAAVLGATGRWDLVFTPDGRVSLARPGEAQVFSAASFDSTEVSLSVAPCASAAAGRYGWSQLTSEIRFFVLRDPCALRRYLLTGAGGLGHPWRKVDGQG